MRPMSSSSSASEFKNWRSPIPYFFGGLSLLLILISVALVILICTKRKHASQSSAEGEDMKHAIPQNIEIDSEPKILVIMAGDDRPTYLGVNDALIFNTFVLCQVFNEFNARKMEKRNVFKGIHRSRLFLGIIGITIILQVVMVEFLKKFADTERLNWGQWAICIGLAAVSWPIGWVVKLIPVPDKPFLNFLSMKK